MVASANGHDKIVELLINGGADITCADKDGCDALMLASQNGHDKVVELIINGGADINHVQKDGCDALMFASENGHEKIVELLINGGADIKTVSIRGYNALILALRYGYANIADVLIKYGADVNHVHKDGWDALMFASGSGLDKIVELLINGGADINHVDNDGWDALMTASKNGHNKVVELLINGGADINHVNNHGWDALMLASHNRHDKVVELLINGGADINRVDKDGRGALMLASGNGHDKVVELLINGGADIKLLQADGWDALMLALQNGHEKVVELLINGGADINRVDKDGRDALMLASDNSHDKIVYLLLKHVLLSQVIDQYNDMDFTNFNRQYLSATKKLCFTVYLLHILFHAFERKYLRILETISSFVDENCNEPETTLQTKFFFFHLSRALKQDVRQDTNTEPSEAAVSEQSNSDFNKFKKSIDCYVKTVRLSHNNQTPSFDELKEFASDVMLEFSNMRVFDASHFFICQRCLKRIYFALNEEDVLKFFTLLLDFNYLDITSRCLKDEKLLDTTAPGFTLTLIRDMLSLWIRGSHASTEFALILAEMDAVETFTDFLISHTNVQNSQSKWIISEVVIILHNIARRKGANMFFSVNKTYDVIKNMEFKEKDTSMIATLLLVLIEDDSTTDTEAIRKSKRSLKETLMHYVTNNEEEELEGYSRSEVLQGLAKIFEQNDDELNEMLPLYPHLKEILKNEDPDEQIFTTQCLRELSRNKEGSEKIITDEELNDMLLVLMNRHDGDLSANVHSILWRAGRTTGILPSKTDVVLSDEFPKKFDVKPMSLGQGGFGSVHLVVDVDQPEDEKFVAKKTHADAKNQKKWMESLQSEASILIKLKHKNIVQFHGYQRKENDIILFLEYIKMGTLSTFIKQHTRLNEGLTRQFTIQILEGVKYLHENNILHLDIKGTNILMLDESSIKLTDFGLSTIYNEEGVEAERGTTRYMAPEMINCPDGRIFKHCCSLDIWSVGSTVVEMITGSPPNSTTASANVLFKIAMLQRPKYELSITASKNLRDFLEKTFTPEAEQRPSAEDLLREDPFITGSS
ncbi:uncharacterized protein LOC131944095 [Physella acuta]|uniref:uncharacterized protein LOC131944095 n=1 Tax=Physella acuta TaxID=109671 RepID=UPI0027DB6C21|nr:uncharacterized protein LOC131944095 [Physella acuta]